MESHSSPTPFEDGVGTMHRIELKFEAERETKNTMRFAEVESDEHPAAVGTLYVSKFTLRQMDNPTKLVVTIMGEEW